MYKDRDKQRAASRERQKRYRAKHDNKDVTPKSNALDVTAKPAHYGTPDCACQHCRQVAGSGSHHTLNHGPYKTATQLAPGELNRVALPGDVDYDGQLTHEGTG